MGLKIGDNNRISKSKIINNEKKTSNTGNSEGAMKKIIIGITISVVSGILVYFITKG